MIHKLRRFINYDSKFFRVFSFFSPDMWTLVTLFFGMASAYNYFLGNFRLGGVFLFATGASDFLDGGVARYLKKETKFGAIFDATIDRLSEGLVLLALMRWYYVAGFALVFSLLVSYIRAKDDRIKTGIAERGERVLVLVISSTTGFTEIGLYIVAVAASITVIMRLLEAKKLNS